MVEDDLSKLRIDKRSMAVRKGRKKRFFLLVLLIVLVIGGGTLYRRGLLSPALDVRVANPQLLYPSQTFTVLNASGYVVAQRKAAVASKITGRLIALSVEEGSRVKTGEVIARLENEDSLAALNRAQANVNLARSTLDQAKAELEDAQISHRRNEQLLAKGFTAQATVDASEARFKRAKAAVAAQEAAVRAGEAALEEAKVLVEYSNIRAPFDGVVLTKNADIGDIVTPLGAAANAKAAVVAMADMSSLQVEVDVSESNISQVRVGQPCEIRLDAFPDLRFRGGVHMIVPTADRTKASVLVKVAFREIDPRILPEMSAKVAFLSREITPEEEKPLKSVPASAVVSRGERSVVFLVEGGRVAERPVRTGRRLDTMVEIVEGLGAGDKIVINPGSDLKSGARVRIPEK
ncbi:MAG: efflux RND transporter periplasmic adaptor subunit [Desulfobacterota bacterium]|jgi:RND family efflux transporter MFP subunit|nr:efflux RND transporter periplasmic adaptor subunit [Thermodesulfobacteriota bacterium]